MTWQAGASRQDVTCWEEGIHLFGWGIPTNRALGAATPMFARALVLDNGAEPVALVVVDIGSISFTLRRFALAALRELYPDCPIADTHILLTATHTHSAPSGYSEYLFYGFAGPGISRTVVETYAKGIARAIGEAWRSREPARIRLGADTLPLNVPIAFNRSLRPYSKNPEAEERGAQNAEEATHRLMTVLRVDRASDGSPLSVFSWFATHATSIHSDNTKVHGDHRGLAALDFEAQLEQEFGQPAVTAFAQEAAGDTTPNFRWDAKRKLRVGAFDDDQDSAQFVADALRRLAYRITTHEEGLDPLSQESGGNLQYIRLPGFRFEAPEVPDAEVELGDAVMGLGFIQGTKEGPGPLHPLRHLARKLTSQLRDAKGGQGRELSRLHGNKLPFLDTGRGRHGNAFGVLPIKYPLLPGALDFTVRTFKYYRSIGALDDNAWTPTTLPFQVIRLGQLWLATVPAEATTVAGARIRAQLLKTIGSPADANAPRPRVVVAAYSNDYAAYVTTYEEYREQWYEGASTLFGPHTLSAMRVFLGELAANVAHGTPLSLPIADPPEFRAELFELRAYSSKPVKVRGYRGNTSPQGG